MRKILAAVAVVFMAAGVAQAQQGRGAGFCTQEDLEKKAGFTAAQLTTSEPIVKKYTDELKTLSDALKDSQDKKADFAKIRTLRTEGMNMILAICTDEEQKKKVTELFPTGKKKNT